MKARISTAPTLEDLRDFMIEEKHAFVSPGWVDFARSYVLGQAEGQDLSGITLRFSEVFTGVPPEIEPDSNGCTGWYIVVEDGRVEVGRGVLENPDLCITVDYETVLPLARAVFAGNEQAAANAQKQVEAAMSAGKMSRQGDDAAMSKLPWLADLHDELARHTL